MGNPVLNFEIAAEAPEKLKAFYEKAFGWKFGKGPHKGVASITTGTKKGIPGYMLDRGGFIPDYVSLYIGAPDLKQAMAKIEKAGGSVIRPPFKPDGKMELAIVSDPEGHVLTLVKNK